MTTVLFIATLVALVSVLIFRKTVPNYRIVAGGLAGVALLFALARLSNVNQVHPDLLMAPVYERSVGHALGQAAVAALPGGGELLVIRLRFDKSWVQKKADAYVEGLEKGLEGSSLTIAGVEPESVFPGAAGGMDDPNIPLPALMELLEEYPDVVGVVSFCGFPDVSLRDLPKEVPPLFVAGTHSLRHGKWILTGRVLAMVIGRPDVEGEVDLSPKRPLEDVFASLNYLVTKDNVREVALKLRQ